MGAVATAVAWALTTANDDTHGYDQNFRWSPDYDCSSFVIQAYEQAGIPVKSNGATYTGNMVDIFKKTGFKDVTNQVNLETGVGLMAGDVVWKTGHTEMCSRTGYLVGARINEKGTITGGQTGDQTGNEISERTYYNSPWTVVLRFPEASSIPSVTPVSGNRYLTEAEKQRNAIVIYQFFKERGWTLNAIAGMLGNMEQESTINPGVWQDLKSGNLNGGVGLVQWTPARNYINWANANGLSPLTMSTQLNRIMYEYTNGEQWILTPEYPISFVEYSHMMESPDFMASVFLHNYERAGVSAEAQRQEYAFKWYEFLSQYEPTNPNVIPVPKPVEKKHSLSLLMMYVATKR